MAQTRGDGSVVPGSRTAYTPYGEEVGGPSPSPWDDDAGYTGHVKDAASGLTYMQARHANPIVGMRFYASDPVGFGPTRPAQFNRYAYGHNDPTNKVDPDGEFANFVVKYALDVGLEVAIQAASGQEIDIGSAVKDAAIGIVDPTKTARKVAKLGALGAAAAKASRKCCFVAGTLVETEDGLRPIEEIEVGDLVWARDTATGETVLKAVTATIPEHDRVIWTVSLSGDAGASASFETTDEHPWWIAEGPDGVLSRWVRTDELAPGMVVVSRDPGGADRYMTVDAAEETGRTEGTYNITVADFETYFVGDERVLVHNCRGSKPPNLSPEGSGRAGALNQAKRDNGIPTSQQPDSTGPNLDRRGNPQPGRQYNYTNSDGDNVNIRDDAGGHQFTDDPSQNRGPHFNDDQGRHYDYEDK